MITDDQALTVAVGTVMDPHTSYPNLPIFDTDIYDISQLYQALTVGVGTVMDAKEDLDFCCPA